MQISFHTENKSDMNENQPKMTSGKTCVTFPIRFEYDEANKSGYSIFINMCVMRVYEHVKAKIWPIYGNIYEAFDTIHSNHSLFSTMCEKSVLCYAGSVFLITSKQLDIMKCRHLIASILSTTKKVKEKENIVVPVYHRTFFFACLF